MVFLDAKRPLVFMHIPKSGGTSLDLSLRMALSIGSAPRFFGRVLFGDIADKEFRSWEDRGRSHLAFDETPLSETGSYVVAHASYPELLLRYPDGQFITFLREPVCRLISLRSFMRGFTDEVICDFGTIGIVLVRARLSLKQFLEHPYFAATYDNVATRMLLHGHSLIPLADFIAPESDATLITDAMNTLKMFDFVGALEDSVSMDNLSAYVGRRITFQTQNKTVFVPSHLRCDLRDELDDKTMELLESHSRLDLHLWRAAMKIVDDQEFVRIRMRAIARCIAQHSMLLSSAG
jgi:hypothetical protein